MSINYTYRISFLFPSLLKEMEVAADIVAKSVAKLKENGDCPLFCGDCPLFWKIK